MIMEQDNRTLEELERDYLSDESAAEFDRLTTGGESRRRRPLIWGSMLTAAAALTLVLTIWPRSRCEFSGIEIAEGIERILDLDSEDIDSVTAKPDGGKVILTALMKDGSSCSYIMSRDKVSFSVEITAANNLKNK